MLSAQTSSNFQRTIAAATLLICVTIFSTTVDAANCAYTIEGPISLAEVQKLDDFIEGASKQESDEPICLNSKEGDFEAGIALSKLISGNGFGSHLEEGADCLGACAIAFLGGSRFDHNQGRLYKKRTMHFTARLGFHAPTSDAVSGDSDVDQPYQNALRLIAELLDQRAKTGLSRSNQKSLGWKVDPWLLKAVLTHHGDDYLRIEKVGDAARLNIEVLGVIDPDKVSFRDEHLRNMCFNHLNLFFHPTDFGTKSNYRINQWGSTRVINVYKDHYWKFPMGTARQNPPKCALVYENGQMLGSTAWDSPDNWGHTPMRWYTRFPADTLLSELPTLVDAKN